MGSAGVRPHPRIRKTVKWGGLAASVVLATAWIGSVWWQFWWYKRDGESVFVVNGILETTHVGGRGSLRNARGHWRLYRVPPAIEWLARLDVRSNPWDVQVPIWSLVLPAALATAVAWRSDAIARRRFRAGACASCGYDRRGLADDAVCPECGGQSERRRAKNEERSP